MDLFVPDLNFLEKENLWDELRSVNKLFLLTYIVMIIVFDAYVSYRLLNI